MNSAEFLDQHFRSIFADYLPKERPIDPPEIPETNLELAVANLNKSIRTDLRESPYWTDLAGFLLKEFEGGSEEQIEAFDQMMIAIMDGEALVLMNLLKPMLATAIRNTAEENIGTLGVVR